MRRFLVLVLMIMVCTGCVTTRVKPPQLKNGMTCEQVLIQWGAPDEILNSRNSHWREGSEETWHYYGKSLKDFDKSVTFEKGEVEYVYVR